MATVAKGKRRTVLEYKGERLDLKPAHGQRMLAVRSKATKVRKVGRDRAKPDTSTYEGRFAARLDELSKAAGFTPPALAERLGLSEQVVYDWLAGRKMPAVGRFPVLAKLFKLKHPGDILPPK